jgi:hypothetical protein
MFGSTKTVVILILVAVTALILMSYFHGPFIDEDEAHHHHHPTEPVGRRPAVVMDDDDDMLPLPPLPRHHRNSRHRRNRDRRLRHLTLDSSESESESESELESHRVVIQKPRSIVPQSIVPLSIVPRSPPDLTLSVHDWSRYDKIWDNSDEAIARFQSVHRVDASGFTAMEMTARKNLVAHFPALSPLLSEVETSNNIYLNDSFVFTPLVLSVTDGKWSDCSFGVLFLKPVLDFKKNDVLQYGWILDHDDQKTIVYPYISTHPFQMTIDLSEKKQTKWRLPRVMDDRSSLMCEIEIRDVHSVTKNAFVSVDMRKV